MLTTTLLLSLSLLAQTPSDYELDDGYWDRWPAWTAGGSHCEREILSNGKFGEYYAFKFSPALVRNMGQQYPRIKMLGPDGITHRMEFSTADGQYHYIASDKYAGKVAHWMERQHYLSKITERELVLPGTKPSAKWNSSSGKLSTGNPTAYSHTKP